VTTAFRDNMRFLVVLSVTLAAVLVVVSSDKFVRLLCQRDLSGLNVTYCPGVNHRNGKKMFKENLDLADLYDHFLDGEEDFYEWFEELVDGDDDAEENSELCYKALRYWRAARSYC